jgi:hypothetical protein
LKIPRGDVFPEAFDAGTPNPLKIIGLPHQYSFQEMLKVHYKWGVSGSEVSGM